MTRWMRPRARASKCRRAPVKVSGYSQPKNFSVRALTGKSRVCNCYLAEPVNSN